MCVCVRVEHAEKTDGYEMRVDITTIQLEIFFYYCSHVYTENELQSYLNMLTVVWSRGSENSWKKEKTGEREREREKERAGH